jgi:hypothetical protein
VRYGPAPQAPAWGATQDGDVSDAQDFDRFFQDLVAGPWDAPDALGRRMAEALRALSLASLAADDREASRLADALEALVATTEPVAATFSRYAPADVAVVDGQLHILPNSRGTHPIMGVASPTAPPLAMGRHDDRITADVVYDARHEGLPGKVQGGFLAAAFDLVLGQAVALGGGRGVTGSLTVRYRITTPLGRPLRYESWHVGGEGRKTTARARLVDAGDPIGAPAEDCTVYCEAEGLFITPRPVGATPPEEATP